MRRRLWVVLRREGSGRAAAPLVGLSTTAANRIVADAGGVSPDLRELSGRRLSLSDREEIACGLAAGQSMRAIAAELGVAPSTVSREVKRGTTSGWRPYRATSAQAAADLRAARPQLSKLAVDERLRDHVQSELEKRRSPEQISRRLVVDFPDDPHMRVSPETIYRSIYVQGRGALRRELAVCLRTGRAVRKPRRTATERRGRIPDMVNISERPAEADDRAVPGHWEGDLIVGSRSSSAIGTLVERSTRFVMLLHLPGGHTAEEVEKAMIGAAAAMPAQLRRTLTWDQGREMSNHARIAAATDLDIYFCDPHSPWQRGSNENTNGLLRQYFPKSSDLSVHDATYLDFVADELNTRPRKTLGWRTPAEALNALLSDPTNGVATTT